MSLFSNEYGPLHSLLQLQDALDRAFEGTGFWQASPSGRGAFPPVDVFSDAEGYVLRMEVPGMSPESLQVESRGPTLRVSGKREPEPSVGSLHRRERWNGEFSRAFQLPQELDVNRAEAHYRHGILTIRVPRREETKPRQIAVSAS